MEKAPLAVVAILLGSFVHAQAPAATKKGPDTGVNPVRLLDRAEVRVLRTEIQPGAIRAVHTHDDVKFHLFLPLTPGIELTIGSDKPVMAEVGQAYFLLKGTAHGFRNTGATTAMVYEVFVKNGPPPAAGEKGALDPIPALLLPNGQATTACPESIPLSLAGRALFMKTTWADSAIRPRCQ
jgi:quercetin dioxygenase-like cupin family protein